MDQPKIERMLRLMMLLTANRQYTIEDLSAKLEISPRTIYRYIDTFKNAGFLIKKKNGCLGLDKCSPYFKDISELVHFTEEEAYILKSAIESIDETNAIKQNLKNKLYSVYDYRIMAECVTNGQNAKNVNRLTGAIEDKKTVIIRGYTSHTSISDRIIEPYEFTTNYISVWGYEPSSGTNKQFKVSRMDEVELTGEDWKYESEHKSAYIDIFRMSGFEQFPIKLELGLMAASLLVEDYPLAEKYMTKCAPDRYILETNVCSYKGVSRFVLGLSDDIKILGSEEFKRIIAERASVIAKELI